MRYPPDELKPLLERIEMAQKLKKKLEIELRDVEIMLPIMQRQLATASQMIEELKALDMIDTVSNFRRIG